MEFPHWLMLDGAVLVVVGLIGFVISRRQRSKVQGDLDTEPSPELRPQLSPPPDLLDSRPRKDPREIGDTQ